MQDAQLDTRYFTSANILLMKTKLHVFETVQCDTEIPCNNYYNEIYPQYIHNDPLM